ncbi:hypothetical protein [Kribbella sp. NPDC049227]|uniref:hypothetical protein n=1 Tax=Kribbella sp. NPDC049227 TaxID=3364113 RepID=UPI003722169A
MTLKAVLFDLDGTLVEQDSAAADRHHVRYQRRELTFPDRRRNRARQFLDLNASDEVRRVRSLCGVVEVR